MDALFCRAFLGVDQAGENHSEELTASDTVVEAIRPNPIVEITRDGGSKQRGCTHGGGIHSKGVG